MRRSLIHMTASLVLVMRWSGTPAAIAQTARGSHPERGGAVPSVPMSELTADQQVRQVLNRLAYGPRPGEVEGVRERGVDAWIDWQLYPERIADPEIDRLMQRYTLLRQSQNDLASDYAALVQARMARRRDTRDTANTLTAADSVAFAALAKTRAQLVGELQSARIARAIGSQRQLLEVMTDFWENHFNIYVRKGPPEPYYLVEYDRIIREHAFGTFRDLLGAVAHSPAMLFYLDNAQSRANPGAPTLAGERRGWLPSFFRRRGRRMNMPAARKSGGLNENYGRELLELHTLGVDGGYTQHDVVDVARALTGWTIRPPKQGGGFLFRSEWHDAGEKAILGHTLPAGRGEEDGEEVLDIIARHPATAHRIALQLARRFVSDSPPAALVDRGAQTFLRTGGNIREVVRTIVTSPEFFSQHAYHAKVKSPFEIVVSAARALDAQPDTTPRTALAVAHLGQPLFGHQAPDGWPETGESWMNAGAILSRINFGMAVAANRLPGISIDHFPGVDSLRRASRERQVDALVQHVLGGAVSPDMRKILLSGEHPLAAGTTQTATGPLSGIAQIIGLAIGSPEFQRH